MNKAILRPALACDPCNAIGAATAEAGYVILDGLPGLTATLTPEAASHMAQCLIEAAEEALRQRGSADLT